MNKIEPFTEVDGNKGYYFYCPACEGIHKVYTHQAPFKKDKTGKLIEGREVPIWTFNGNFERPTFRPSVKVTFEHLSEAGQIRQHEFHKKHNRYPTNVELPFDTIDICHLILTDGILNYCNDCTHAFKNKKVELPDFHY